MRPCHGRSDPTIRRAVLGDAHTTYHGIVTRRGDPERIYSAQRAGIYMRLTRNERVSDLDAEHLIARWEREAEAAGQARDSAGYWDDGWDWIAAQRTTGR